MSEYDETIQQITETLKEPVRIDPALNARVMAEVNRLPARGQSSSVLRSAWYWLRSPRTLRVSPIGGFAAAAALSLAVFLGARTFDSSGPQAASPTAVSSATPAVQFVLVAPEAASVSLVGDFNDWDVSATPLMRGGEDGVWAVTIPLNPGRYRYSFLVDGTTWQRDPQAARTVEDEFGRPNSVLTIGGA